MREGGREHGVKTYLEGGDFGDNDEGHGAKASCERSEIWWLTLRVVEGDKEETMDIRYESENGYAGEGDVPGIDAISDAEERE